MIEDEAPAFGPGHNVPPSMMEDAVEAQRQALEPYRERRDELVRHKARVVRDRQSAADAADVIRVASKVWKIIEAERLQRSNPYRETANAIAAAANEFWAPVEEVMIELRARIDAWDKAEEARIESQRREQAAELARLTAGAIPPPAAPPIPARRQRIRGDLGATITATDRQQFEIEDWRLLPDWLMDSVTVRNAILTVARTLAKHRGEIPGIRVSTVTETTIR
ncbi:MAG TPA: hypothetical protein VGA98_07535 [Allosphingosinicella sp.]|jgi:hypothetical protein